MMLATILHCTTSNHVIYVLFMQFKNSILKNTYILLTNVILMLIYRSGRRLSTLLLRFWTQRLKAAEPGASAAVPWVPHPPGHRREL